MVHKSNILFISTFYPQRELLQYCQFVHEEAKALVRKGYHITVINPRSDINASYSWELEDIPVLCIPYQAWRTNYSYSINGIFLFHALRKLGKSFFSQFSFIHVHNCLPEGKAALLLKKEFQLDIPMAVQIHDLNVEKGAYIRSRIAKRFFSKCCREIYRDYDYCIGVSNMVSHLIRSCLPPADRKKVFTAYNGYDPAIFNVSSNHIKAASPIRILFVGNLIELKGIRCLIHAYCQCVPHFSVPTELWILGRGILEKELQGLAHDYHMDDHIFFKGYVLPEKVGEYMNECHIFAMPSTFEGFGCVYLEAMACGLPCIACTGQGISEIIENSRAGCLIPPHNLDALKNSLLELVNHPATRESYRKRISEIIDNYTWDKTVSPIVKIYQ